MVVDSIELSDPTAAGFFSTHQETRRPLLLRPYALQPPLLVKPFQSCLELYAARFERQANGTL